MFDPYRKWLGIPEDQRPPNHYQLLGIAPDEQDLEVIEAAAVRQSAFVRNFQSGKYGAEATRLLTEIAAARLCLLDPAKRARYDTELRQQRTAPRRPSSGGSGPDIGLAPLDDDHGSQRAATPPVTAPAPEPVQPASSAHRSAPPRPAAPSQSSARYRDLAPRPAATPRPRDPTAHRTPPPASAPPPAVELIDMGPRATAPRSRRAPRLGKPRRATYAKPNNPIGLVWQIPLVIIVFIALVLAANAVGRQIAISKSAARPAPVGVSATNETEADGGP